MSSSVNDILVSVSPLWIRSPAIDTLFTVILGVPVNPVASPVIPPTNAFAVIVPAAVISDAVSWLIWKLEDTEF